MEKWKIEMLESIPGWADFVNESQRGTEKAAAGPTDGRVLQSRTCYIEQWSGGTWRLFFADDDAAVFVSQAEAIAAAREAGYSDEEIILVLPYEVVSSGRVTLAEAQQMGLV